MLVFRPGGADDVAAIVALLSRAAGTGLFSRAEPDVRAHLRGFLVAAASGRVVGCIAVVPLAGGVAEIESVAVDPDHRGTGLGGRLVAAAVERARSDGASVVYLATREPGYFRRHGFRVVGMWRTGPAAVRSALRLLGRPPREWWGAVTGGYVFMARRLEPDAGAG